MTTLFEIYKEVCLLCEVPFNPTLQRLDEEAAQQDPTVVYFNSITDRVRQKVAARDAWIFNSVPFRRLDSPVATNDEDGTPRIPSGTTLDPYPYRYVFAMPGDYITGSSIVAYNGTVGVAPVPPEETGTRTGTILRWQKGGDANDFFAYDLKGRYLYANVENVTISYNRDIEDFTQWSPVAINIFILEMANVLSGVFNSIGSVKDRIKRDLVEVTQGPEYIDAIQVGGNISTYIVNINQYVAPEI